MNPWVMLGIGFVIGLLVGLFVSGLGRASEEDEFNEKGEYKCNYSSEDQSRIDEESKHPLHYIVFDEYKTIRTDLTQEQKNILEEKFLKLKRQGAIFSSFDLELNPIVAKNTLFCVPKLERMAGESSKDFLNRLAKASAVLVNVGDPKDSKE